LNVIFGLSWPSVVNLTADLDALVVDLPAGFPFRYHLLDPLLGEPQRPIVDRLPAVRPAKLPAIKPKLLPGQPHPKDRG
jgi:hypothetical protein